MHIFIGAETKTHQPEAFSDLCKYAVFKSKNLNDHPLSSDTQENHKTLISSGKNNYDTSFSREGSLPYSCNKKIERNLTGKTVASGNPETKQGSVPVKKYENLEHPLTFSIPPGKLLWMPKIAKVNSNNGNPRAELSEKGEVISEIKSDSKGQQEPIKVEERKISRKVEQQNSCKATVFKNVLTAKKLRAGSITIELNKPDTSPGLTDLPSFLLRPDPNRVKEKTLAEFFWKDGAKPRRQSMDMSHHPMDVSSVIDNISVLATKDESGNKYINQYMMLDKLGK